MGTYSRNVRLPRVRIRLVVGLALGAVALAVPVAVSAQSALSPSPRPPGELVRLVRQDCGSCHGLTLRGGLGKPLLPENLAGRDAKTLAQIILDGIPGTPMPPWRGILSERDALWIARRLKEGFPDATP